MPASKAQQKAVTKYMRENYDEIKVRVEKGRRDIVKSHAEARGESVNGFVNRAISETMERDTPTRPQEAAGAALGVGAVLLPSETIKTDQRAVE